MEHYTKRLPKVSLDEQTAQEDEPDHPRLNKTSLVNIFLYNANQVNNLIFKGIFNCQTEPIIDILTPLKTTV
jgi:hypothetical protein